MLCICAREQSQGIKDIFLHLHLNNSGILFSFFLFLVCVSNLMLRSVFIHSNNLHATRISPVLQLPVFCGLGMMYAPGHLQQ